MKFLFKLRFCVVSYHLITGIIALTSLYFATLIPLVKTRLAAGRTVSVDIPPLNVAKRNCTSNSDVKANVANIEKRARRTALRGCWK